MGIPGNQGSDQPQEEKGGVGRRLRTEAYAMKRILLVIIALMLLAPGVVAFKETFQDYSNDYMYTYNDIGYGNGIAMVNTTTGDVIYKIVSGNYLVNTNPQATTYFAFDYVRASYAVANIVLCDSTHAVIQAQGVTVPASYDGRGRIEVKITSGVPKYYLNGNLYATGAAIASNPVYIHLGNGGAVGSAYGYFDNIVYGETDHYVAASIPPNWTLLRDLLNPSANGVYAWNPNTDAWVSKSSYHFYEFASKEFNNTPSYLDIKHYMTGTVVNTTTITYNRDTLDFNVPAFVETSTSVGATLPDGLYSIGFRDSTQMETFTISSTGAVLNLDQTDYAAGSTATATYDIGAGYWDLSTYSYRVDFFDIYGNVISTSPVTAQSGTKTYTFKTTDNVGVYYAALIASPLSDSSTDYWFGYDVCELVGYIKYVGGIYDAESEAQITSNVTVTINQGSITDTIYTETGVYNSTDGLAFGTGSLTTFTVSAAGYQTSNTSFTPMIAKTITKNITLIRSSPTCPVGICLGGLANETIYSRPVPAVTIAVTNATYGESYTTSTNSVGWYNLGESDGVFFTNGRCYSVTASKTGYTGNTYLKCVVGT